MNRKLLFGIGIVAVGVAVLFVLLLAAIRVKEARQFSQKHRRWHELRRAIAGDDRRQN